MSALISDILTLPFAVAGLALGALQFSADAFIETARSREAQTAALVIAFLAGMSEMLGQSVILVVNRVPLYRFLASLAFTGLSYSVTVVTWGLAALAVAPLTRLGAFTLADFLPVTGVLALAFAPRLLGVFSLAPYFGEPLGVVLETWSLALAVFGLYVAFALPAHAALFCGFAGWLVSFGFRSFVGRAMAGPLGRLRTAVSGSSLEKTPAQIIDDMMAALSRTPAP